MNMSIKDKAKVENYVFPASRGQKRLWILSQMNPGDTSYNMTYIMEFTGFLSSELAVQAWQNVVNHHEILRTIFEENHGEVNQVVLPTLEIDVDIIKVEDFTKNTEEFVRDKALEMSKYSFNLEDGPLIKISLVQVNPELNYMLLSIHHIICDGWSMNILIDNFVEAYTSLVEGDKNYFLEPNLQYADFTIWQNQLLELPEIKNQREYWKNKLNGELPFVQLSTKTQNLKNKNQDGSFVNVSLNKEIAERLRKLAAKNNSTLFMVLMGIFNILLSNYTNLTDLLIASPIAGRKLEKLDRLIGFFTNTVIYRTDLDGNPSFKELLDRIRSECLAVFDNQDVPFDQIVNDVRNTNGSDIDSLLQVMFSLQTEGNNRNREIVDDLRLNIKEVFNSTFKFNLELYMLESDTGISATFIYNSELYSRPFIEQLANHYINLILAVLEDECQKISEYQMLGDHEIQFMLTSLNSTRNEWSLEKCVHHLIEEQAERFPSKVALIHNGESLTFSDLNNKANQLANYLIQLGAVNEKFIGIHLERSLDWVIAMLAILKTGRAYVPLDPSYPLERIKFAIGDTGLKTIITNSTLSGKLGSTINCICMDTHACQFSSLETKNIISHVSKEDLAYVIYTSGSTGKPKGVLIKHKGLTNLVHWHHQTYGVTPEDIGTQAARMGFDAHCFELWPFITAGATVLIIDYEMLLNTKTVKDFIVNNKVTISHLPVPIAENLITEDWPANTKLRVLQTGSDRLVKRPSLDLPFKYVNHYGPTECTVICTSGIVTPYGDSTYPNIGRPISNMQVYILNKYLKPVPIGVKGELYVGGEGIAQGYLNRLNLNENRFVINPFAIDSEEKLYKTGDMARYMPDGTIDFIGREDNQLKIRGFRIELNEIERSLSTYEGIIENVVVLRTDTNDNKLLISYIVCSSEKKPKSSELRAYLAKMLPDYMIPSTFVLLDKLPLTVNGKVDRLNLPEPTVVYDEEDFVAPSTDSEVVLCNIFKEVLNIKSISVNDHFLYIGGHSLLAAKLISRIREKFHVQLPLRAVLEIGTVRGLIKEINDQNPMLDKLQTKIQHQPGDIFELSYGQERLWMTERLNPNQDTYNVPVVFNVQGAFCIEAMQFALNTLVQRHCSLRTVFRENSGKPYQIILPHADMKLETELHNHLPDSQRIELVKQYCKVPFDLENGPLIRAKVFKYGDKSFTLCICIHHIVCDGWSINLLIGKLSTLYKNFINGVKSNLDADSDATKIQYYDYAVWEKAALDLNNQLEFWTNHLGNKIPVLQLHKSISPFGQSLEGGNIKFSIPDTLLGDINKLCGSLNVTPYMMFLTVYCVLLSRYTNVEDMIIGSPISNRNHPALEDIIGFFVNTVAYRFTWNDDETFDGLLKYVREIVLSAYENRIVPYQHVVDSVRNEQEIVDNPLFQAFFVYQNDIPQLMKLPDIEVSKVDLHNSSQKFPISLEIQKLSDGFSGVLECSSGLLDYKTIEQMSRHFVILLEALVMDSSRRINYVKMLTTEEQKQLSEWNETIVDFDLTKPIHQLFTEQAKRMPESTALVFEGRSWSYQQLDNYSDNLARKLKEAGVLSGDFIGICLERSLNMVVGLLSILKCGAAYVPIDPEAPLNRNEYIISDANPTFILTSSKYEQMIKEVGGRPFLLTQEALEHNSQIIKSLPIVSPDSSMYLIYTSGTTGKPKGVIVKHRGVVNRLIWMQQLLKLNQEDVVLQKTPYTFDVSVWEIFVPIITGSKLVLATHNGHKDATYLRDLILSEKITTVHFVPSMLQVFLPILTENLKALKRVICSGEALTYKLQNQFFEALPDTQLYNFYGPTEASISATYFNCKRNYPYDVVPIGKPITNMKVFILDKNQNIVPVGVPGEIYLSGVGLASGYLNRPDITTERFVSVPNVTGQHLRMYRTGDIGRYLPDGNIDYLGRTDDQVKIRGFRIELSEISNTLLTYPQINNAVVIMREYQSLGKKLIAYINSQSTDIDESEIRAYLSRYLPEYMIPSAFVFLRRLPLNSNGKVDKKSLPDPVWGDLQRNNEGESLSTLKDSERKLIGVWREVLGIDSITTHDNFFEIGGDSLLAIQVAARANKLGISISARDMFVHQTIAAGIKHAESISGIRAAAVDVKPIVRNVLSPIQQWFFDLPLTNVNHWNFPLSVKVLSELDLAKFKSALEIVVQNHGSLGTKFKRVSDQWQVFVTDKQQVDFHFYDLSNINSEEQHNEMVKVASSLQSSLDISAGPLTRIGYFKTGQHGEDQLLLVFHHLIMDGYSWRIFLEDVEEVYKLLVNNEVPDIIPEQTTYTEWCSLLSSYAKTPELYNELSYWKEQLKKVPFGGIPIDFDMGENTEESAAQIQLSLSSAETEDLIYKLPKKYGTHINDVLLTVLLITMKEFTGLSKLAVNLEGHGREEIFPGVNLSKTIGWFTTLFPVVLEYDMNTIGLVEILLSVKEQLAKIPNKGLGYGVLRYLSSYSEQLSEFQMPTVCFNYLGQFSSAEEKNDKIFILSNESLGDSHSFENQRDHIFNLNSMIFNGRLQMTWVYSTNLHKKSTVEKLANIYISKLKKILTEI